MRQQGTTCTRSKARSLPAQCRARPSSLGRRSHPAPAAYRTSLLARECTRCSASAANTPQVQMAPLHANENMSGPWSRASPGACTPRAGKHGQRRRATEQILADGMHTHATPATGAHRRTRCSSLSASAAAKSAWRSVRRYSCSAAPRRALHRPCPPCLRTGGLRSGWPRYATLCRPAGPPGRPRLRCTRHRWPSSCHCAALQHLSTPRATCQPASAPGRLHAGPPRCTPGC